jgi:hypothetical protein
MNNKYRAILFSFLAAVLLITFNSCIGLSMNIQMNKDGSGKLTIEYRVSKLISSLGALDGNESMPTIPIGRTDWENSIVRIPGAKLSSYSSVESKLDTEVKIVIDYLDELTLSELLDPLEKKLSIDRQGQSGSIEMLIFDGSDSIDESKYDKDFLDLMRVFWEGYNFSFSFSGPGNSTMTITDGAGNIVPIQSAAQTTLSGKNVSYSIGIMELLELKEGLGFIFAW